MKIYIATPMYGGIAKSFFVASLQNLVQVLNSRGHTVVHSSTTNESLITRARNTLAHQFMKSDYDALLFIDADHGFNAEDVALMVDSGKDLIGAIYPMKTINWDNVRNAALLGLPNLSDYSGAFAINYLPEAQSFNGNEPFKVRDIGTGMMFVRRNVFEALKTVVPVYKNNSPMPDIAMGEDIYEYFTTVIDPDGQILLSEDYAFCKFWRDLGNDVYAAPWVAITHSGDYNYDGRFLKSLELAQAVQQAQAQAEAVANLDSQAEQTPEDSSQLSDTTSADSVSESPADSDGQQSSDKKTQKSAKK